MPPTARQTDPQTAIADSAPRFSHQIAIRPLGLLYGSAGPFLSPENLVGRSGSAFPPSTTTLSGLVAHQLGADSPQLASLRLAGPFWADDAAPENFYVPTPRHCLVYHQGEGDAQRYWIGDRYRWQADAWQRPDEERSGQAFKDATWLAIADWPRLQTADPQPIPVRPSPWEFLPHLHPRLATDQRKVASDDGGSLFLENAVQLPPEVCLVYLTNAEIPAGWYRFGGEGHLVALDCQPLGAAAQQQLNAPIASSFATIAPSIWGSNRLSYRAPQTDPARQEADPEALTWNDTAIAALLASRPQPLRHRLGRRPGASNAAPRPLARGRYALPAGSVYQLAQPLDYPTWQDWPTAWFPCEAFTFKRWGFGLSLPVDLTPAGGSP